MITGGSWSEEMKILAIDSSSLVAAAALVEDDILISEYTLNYKKTHSQTLMGMIDEILKRTETAPSELGALAFTKGPGSFTGLRIGAASIKGLSAALDIPVIGVPTLEAMAYNFWGSDKLICPMLDARRNQVYAGMYSFGEKGLEIIMDQSALSAEEFAQRINAEGREAVLLGDGLPVFLKTAGSSLRVPYMAAPASHNRQRAASVAVLAGDYYKRGLYKDENTELCYLRLSQAERERAERLGSV